MKIILKLISKLLGPRAELKVEAACSEDDNVFQILRNDYKWRQVRNKFIETQPECQMCQDLNDLHVHHIKPWHLCKEGRYDFYNLITLCQSCHFRFGHWRNWRNYNPHINKIIDLIVEHRT